MSTQSRYAPADTRWLTPGVIILALLMLNGTLFTIIRFVRGLSSVTNLDNLYAWGIWKAIGVASFVAIAAGGFTSVALLDIFHRHAYLPIKRVALVIAMVGYTTAVISLFIDLGRYYNIWHPILPSMWSPQSALFEVAMCVMTYLMVLYFEFLPVFIEFLSNQIHTKKILSNFYRVLTIMIHWFDRIAQFFMPVAILLGVVLSLMHQSALGSLMLIASTKMHPLWLTPILPLLFLLSAAMCGFPSVISAYLGICWSTNRKPDLPVVSSLARMALVPLGLYLIAKIVDLNIRSRLSLLVDGSLESWAFLLEIGLGVVLPMMILLHKKRRQSPIYLFSGSALIVIGVIINRVNVYLTAFTPPTADYAYFPSFGEISITVGLAAGMLFFFRLFVVIFPILPADLRTARRI